MMWTSIQTEIPIENLDQAAAIAQMVVPYGIYIEDYSNLEQEVAEIAHMDLIDEDLLTKDRQKAIIHIYIAPDQNPNEAMHFLKERLQENSIPFVLKMDEVKEEDWATAWQKYYHPIRIMEHFVICPAWEECNLAAEDIQLTLNPGMAFGTGTHETTRLCIQALGEVIRGGEKVLDVGCGSGVLSLAALLLGASRATGVDIDETAIQVAKENAALNHIGEEQLELKAGDLVDKVEGKYDIVCANIVADVVIRLAEIITPYVEKDGILICSGIIRSREDEVVHAIEQAGFCIEQTSVENDWLAMQCRYIRR